MISFVIPIRASMRKHGIKDNYEHRNLSTLSPKNSNITKEEEHSELKGRLNIIWPNDRSLEPIRNWLRTRNCNIRQTKQNSLEGNRSNEDQSSNQKLEQIDNCTKQRYPKEEILVSGYRSLGKLGNRFVPPEQGQQEIDPKIRTLEAERRGKD